MGLGLRGSKTTKGSKQRHPTTITPFTNDRTTIPQRRRTYHLHSHKRTFYFHLISPPHDRVSLPVSATKTNTEMPNFFKALLSSQNKKQNPYLNASHPSHTPIPTKDTSTPFSEHYGTSTSTPGQPANGSRNPRNQSPASLRLPVEPASPRGSVDFLAEARVSAGRDPVTGRVVGRGGLGQPALAQPASGEGGGIVRPDITSRADVTAREGRNAEQGKRRNQQQLRIEEENAALALIAQDRGAGLTGYYAPPAPPKPVVREYYAWGSERSG